MKHMPTRSATALSGNLWLNRAEHKFLGGDRINLLEKIDELGSITKAAKAVGIPMKAGHHNVEGTIIDYVQDVLRISPAAWIRKAHYADNFL
ncbi:MAG: hypothetical protein PHH91_04850 [Desulfuromonadaceae bacterium]|nr:hypothetical protein [Desulfuromonadaceae bacterium]